MVAKLPDSGDKIRKQISELRQRLQTVNNASSIRRKEPEVISIDDVTEELNKVILMWLCFPHHFMKYLSDVLHHFIAKRFWLCTIFKWCTASLYKANLLGGSFCNQILCHGLKVGCLASCYYLTLEVYFLYGWHVWIWYAFLIRTWSDSRAFLLRVCIFLFFSFSLQFHIGFLILFGGSFWWKGCTNGF